MIERWSKYPADEFIPLMREMFDYSLRVILFTLYGFSSNSDDQLIRTVHASLDVVSSPLSLSTVNL